eukprot:s1269_g25.t1
MAVENLEMQGVYGVQVRQGKLWGLAGAIKRLGHSSDWRVALDLLQQCLCWEPDVPAFNAAVTVLGGTSSWRNSLAMVDTMEASLIQPNVITFGGLLRALEPGGWLRAMHFFHHLSRISLETNVILVNTALADSRSGKRWRFGLNILAAAASNGLELDIVSFNSAVVVSGQCNTWECSVTVLQQLQRAQDSNLRSDAITRNSCIQCCVEGRPLHSWKHVLFLTGETEQGPNLSGFNAAVNGLAKARKWQEAVAVFREIPANSFARDLRSFHAVASATDSWAKLLQLCINLEELNLQTDVVLGNMYCSCSRRDWQNSLLLSRILFQKSLEPDSVTASALASAHGYLHRWRHSMTFLQVAPMNARAAAVDTEYVRASCLDACAKRFAWEAALSLAPRPVTGGELEDTVYLAAIEGQSKASQWLCSVQQLENLNSRGLRQNVLMYSALGSGQETTAWEEAVAMFRAGWSRSLQPDAVLFNAVARLSAAENWLLSINLLGEILQCSLHWTDTTYTAGLVAVENSHWSRCGELLSQSQEHGVFLGGAPLAAGIRCCCSGQAWPYALNLLQGVTALAALDANRIFPEFEAAIAACISGNAFQISRSQIEENRHYFLAYLLDFKARLQKTK